MTRAATIVGFQPTYLMDNCPRTVQLLEQSPSLGIAKCADFTLPSSCVFAKEAHVLLGGFPCQPFFLCGRLEGVHDRRAGVLGAALSALATLRPCGMTLECVANFPLMYRGSLVAWVERWARAAGLRLCVQKPCLTAWLPQARDRVVLIFLREEYCDAGHTLFSLAFTHDPAFALVTLEAGRVLDPECDGAAELRPTPEEIEAYFRTPGRMPSAAYPRVLAGGEWRPPS
jgi:site-specific DNA-cytosine methylase